MRNLYWVETDGGRAAAGWRGEAGDCAARALSIAVSPSWEDFSSGHTYNQVREVIELHARDERPGPKKKRSSARDGVHRPTFRKIMDHYGWTWRACTLPGKGATMWVHPDHLPQGVLVLGLSKHYAAYVGTDHAGFMLDTHPYHESRMSGPGKRQVYGYWTPPPGWTVEVAAKLVALGPHVHQPLGEAA